MSRARIAVLASGGGSNLQALLDHLRALGGARSGDVVLVASNRPDAGALDRARRAGIDTALLVSKHAPEGHELLPLLEQFDADLVVLAGYLKLVPAPVTQEHRGRVINVHPAPLPSFGGAGMYGERVHRAILAAGAPVSGPTVHFVDDQYDHGATIAHWPVPVLSTDDDRALAARVLRAEHLLFPRVVDAVAGDRITLDTLHSPITLPLFDETLGADVLGRSADDALAPLTHSR